MTDEAIEPQAEHWVWTAPDGERTLITASEAETPQFKLHLLNHWYQRKISPINHQRNVAEFEIRTGTQVVPPQEPA